MKKIEIAAGVICKNETKYLVAQRTEPQALAGLWEFPGGQIESGETVHQALTRELYEELGVDVTIIEDLETFTGVDNNLEITIHFVKCELDNDEEDITLSEHSDWTWIHEDNFENFEYTKFAQKMIDTLFI